MTLLAKAWVYVSGTHSIAIVLLGLDVDVEVLLHADDPVPVGVQQPEQVLTLPLRHPQPRHPLQRSLEIFFAKTKELSLAGCCLDNRYI